MSTGKAGPDENISSESRFRYQPTSSEEDPWTACLQPLYYEDTVQVTAWRDEVQNLLIFAGLFSAVVTAFIVESYQSLKPDSGDQVLLLLSTIASTLQNDSTPATFIPLTQTNTPFSPPPSSIRVNILWFTSLVLSLTAVLVGIVSLQWLREYRNYPAHLTAQQRFAMRNMHAEGFKEWYVPQIFSSLPLLLQVALVLFLIGIAEFLLPLSREVAGPVIAIAGIPMLFMAVTTITPALQRSPSWNRVDWTAGIGLFGAGKAEGVASVASQCPYKSPQSWAFYRLTPRWTVSLLYTTLSLIPGSLHRAYQSYIRAITRNRSSNPHPSIRSRFRRAFAPLIRHTRILHDTRKRLSRRLEEALWGADQEYPIHTWPAFSCVWLHNRNTTVTGLWHGDALTNPQWQYDAFSGIDKLLAMNYPHDASGASCVEQCITSILEEGSERLESIVRKKLSALQDSKPTIWPPELILSSTAIDAMSTDDGNSEAHDSQTVDFHLATRMNPALYAEMSQRAKTDINALEVLSCSSILLREDRGVVQAHMMELLLRIYRELLVCPWGKTSSSDLRYGRGTVLLPYEGEYYEATRRLWKLDPYTAAHFEVQFVKLFEEFISLGSSDHLRDERKTVNFPLAGPSFVRIIHRIRQRAFLPHYPPKCQAIILDILTNCHASMTKILRSSIPSSPQPDLIALSFGPLLASPPFNVFMTTRAPPISALTPPSASYPSVVATPDSSSSSNTPRFNPAHLSILHTIVAYVSWFRANAPQVAYYHVQVQARRPGFAAGIKDLVLSLLQYQIRVGSSLFVGWGDDGPLMDAWVSVQKEVLTTESGS